MESRSLKRRQTTPPDRLVTQNPRIAHMQQAKRPRIESRNPNTYFLGIGRFAPQSGQRCAQPQPQLRALTFTALIDLLW